ncbi:MAG: PAS domain-containing protein [Melioribacteraceae bacterium]|nr:PAS domain-containing protein [Melioribacteraceae bacterium]
MKNKATPNNKEMVLRDEDFIVSKTDLKGKITYCNEIFIEFAKYDEADLLNKNHNVIRHPDMPGSIFKLLWDTIQSGSELNAYVKNMAADGSFYWVLANVTPVLGRDLKPMGYYSVRRKPKKAALDVIVPLYKELRALENRSGKKEGIELSTKMLNNFLNEKGISYEKFILSI